MKMNFACSRFVVVSVALALVLLFLPSHLLAQRSQPVPKAQPSQRLQPAQKVQPAQKTQPAEREDSFEEQSAKLKSLIDEIKKKDGQIKIDEQAMEKVILVDAQEDLAVAQDLLATKKKNYSELYNKLFAAQAADHFLKEKMSVYESQMEEAGKILAEVYSYVAGADGAFSQLADKVKENPVDEKCDLIWKAYAFVIVTEADAVYADVWQYSMLTDILKNIEDGSQDMIKIDGDLQKMKEFSQKTESAMTSVKAVVKEIDCCMDPSSDGC